MREGCIPALGMGDDRRAFSSFWSKLVSGNIPRRGRPSVTIQLPLWADSAPVDVVMAAPMDRHCAGTRRGMSAFRRQLLAKGLSINFAAHRRRPFRPAGDDKRPCQQASGQHKSRSDWPHRNLATSMLWP